MWRCTLSSTFQLSVHLRFSARTGVPSQFNSCREELSSLAVVTGAVGVEVGERPGDGEKSLGYWGEDMAV